MPLSVPVAIVVDQAVPLEGVIVVFTPSTLSTREASSFESETVPLRA